MTIRQKATTFLICLFIFTITLAACLMGFENGSFNINKAISEIKTAYTSMFIAITFIFLFALGFVSLIENVPLSKAFKKLKENIKETFL